MSIALSSSSNIDLLFDIFFLKDAAPLERYLSIWINKKLTSTQKRFSVRFSIFFKNSHLKMNKLGRTTVIIYGNRAENRSFSGSFRVFPDLGVRVYKQTILDLISIYLEARRSHEKGPYKKCSRLVVVLDLVFLSFYTEGNYVALLKTQQIFFSSTKFFW